MKRKTPWRLAGTGTVALLVLAGLLLLLANLYVQSPGVQDRLRGELSTALQMPVALRKTTFTPWEGLRIDGIHAAPADGTAGVELSAESFRARLALWPLVRERRVVVRDVLFDRPTLAWTQTEDGGWRWSGARPAPEPVDAQEPNDGSPPPAAAPAPEPATPPVPPAVRAQKVSRSGLLPVVLENVRVRHGRFELRDRRGAAVAKAEDVNADGGLDPAGEARGTLWLKRAAWGGGGPDDYLALDDFRAPFTFDGETLRLPGGRGRLATGEVRLDGSLRPREPGTPFEARGELANVSLAALLNRAGLSFDLAAGQVAGNFALSGLAADQRTQVGQGRLRITGGELHGVPLLASVGDALGIEDLRRLKLDDAHADCSLNGPNLRVEPVVLASRNLRVEASGDARLDRAGSRDPAGLDLQARLTLGRAITRQLPQFVENNFTPVPDSTDGARYLDFHVGGPLQSPSTDLKERILGKGSLRDMLEDFFGGDKPKDKKKKPR